jgi:nucleotide-binding universal stress UspA family protein
VTDPAAYRTERREPVIVGYRATDEGRDALALGALLARALGAPLVVACVYAYEPPLYIGAEEYQAMVRDDAEAALAGAASELPRDLPAGVGTVALSSPPPARGLRPAAALAELAEASSARTLVVGSSSHGRAGGVLAGGVARRLLHGAACPVAVAERGIAGHAASLDRIGVAFDGRPESQAALDLAASLATATGAGLRLISVLEPLRWVHASLSPGYLVSWLDQGRESTAARQADAVERLPQCVQVETVVREGTPTMALIEESGALDLLVSGSRGYGPVGRLLLGGVSARLVRDAGCSVLVAPRPQTPTEGASLGGAARAPQAAGASGSTS